MARRTKSRKQGSQTVPNMILVLIDNLGWGELGVYGGGVIRGAATPRLDKLASEGCRLLNFNVEAQCTPSRAALMTGRYAVRTGNGSVAEPGADLKAIVAELEHFKAFSQTIGRSHNERLPITGVCITYLQGRQYN